MVLPDHSPLPSASELAPPSYTVSILGRSVAFSKLLLLFYTFFSHTLFMTTQITSNRLKPKFQVS
jgi:hypothetical protein